MTAYLWRDSSVRAMAHAYETRAGAVVDDVSACGTGGMAATLDGEALHGRCEWCQRIAAHGEREAARRAAEAAYERARVRRMAAAGRARRRGVAP